MTERFDPSTARWGDVFRGDFEGQLTYIGKAPRKRDGEDVFVFQRYNSNLTGLKRSSVLGLQLVRIPRQEQPEEQQPETKKRSKTMDKNIAAILRDDTTTIDVSMPDGKNLTYVTDLQLKVGDLVVLPTNSGQYAVRPVAAVHDELRIEPNSEIEYKWVVDVVDLARYQQNMESNELIDKTMAETYRKSARHAFRQSALAAAAEEDRAKLEEILNSKRLSLT